MVSSANFLIVNDEPSIDTSSLYIMLILDPSSSCLLYTSDAADDLLCVDLGGRRIIKKKKKKYFFFFFFFYFFFFFFFVFFFFKQKTAYEIASCLVGSEMCIRDRMNSVINRLSFIPSEFSTPELTSK